MIPPLGTQRSLLEESSQIGETARLGHYLKKQFVTPCSGKQLGRLETGGAHASSERIPSLFNIVLLSAKYFFPVSDRGRCGSIVVLANTLQVRIYWGSFA